MDKIEEFVGDRSVSVRTIARKLKLKHRKVNGYMKYSSKFEKVDPQDVGSNKMSVNVWRRIH